MKASKSALIDTGMRGEQSVGQTRICLQRAVRQQLDRLAGRGIDRHHLIVFAMHQQHRQGDGPRSSVKSVSEKAAMQS